VTSRRADDHPVTPDGRYLVVKGRLWRASYPGLDPSERIDFVLELMTARREVGAAVRRLDEQAVVEAR